MLGISNLMYLLKPKDSKGMRFMTVVHMAMIGVALGFIMMATMASAQPPLNDDFDNATLIPGLPFTDAINTSEATTANDDPDCVGQGPTVWYSFTPTEDIRIEANTFGSDYDTTLSVYTGSRGALTLISCNDDAIGLQSRIHFDAIAGETYFFMVGAFASGPGSNLVFTVDEAPPPPSPLEIDLSIDSVGSFTKAGDAIIHGTVMCSRWAFVDLFGELKQQVGRFKIQGFFGLFLECDGETPWTATVTSESGLYKGGKAGASASAFAFDPENGEVAFDEESRTVQLRRSR
jgi:hypothetical protein